VTPVTVTPQPAPVSRPQVRRAKAKVKKVTKAAKRTTERVVPKVAAAPVAVASSSNSALRAGGFLLVVLVLADSVLLAVSAKYLREAN
jgi:hypothetical protein